jgi:hypothetical protein
MEHPIFNHQSRLPEILEWLQKLSDGTVDRARCLEELCRILRDELDTVGAELNTHNYVQVVNRLTYELFTGCADDYKITLIKYNESPDDAKNAAFRACSVLMLRIQGRFNDSAIKAAAIRLDTYIEEMGYLPEFYVECGDRVSNR